MVVFWQFLFSRFCTLMDLLVKEAYKVGFHLSVHLSALWKTVIITWNVQYVASPYSGCVQFGCQLRLVYRVNPFPVGHHCIMLSLFTAAAYSLAANFGWFIGLILSLLVIIACGVFIYFARKNVRDKPPPQPKLNGKGKSYTTIWTKL